MMPEEPRSAEQPEKRAKQYHRIHLKLSLTRFALSIAFLLGILFSGASIFFRNSIQSFSTNPWLVVGGYGLVFYLLIELLSLPLSYYGGFVVEHRFRLSTQSRRAWFRDRWKGIGLNFLLGLLMLEIFYYIIRINPQGWWLPATVVFVFIFIILARLAPVVFLPIFFKLKELEGEELKMRLRELAERAGTKVRGIYQMDLSKKSKTVNAALAGWGKTRRMILSDTLLQNFTPEETEAVVAHELGHQVGYHTWRMMAMQIITMGLSLFLCERALRRTIPLFPLQGMDDVAGLPLVILIVSLLGLVFLPLVNAYSRHMERGADRFSLRNIESPEYFISAMEKLAELNLADRSPHPLVEYLFYSHPPIGKRIKEAERIIE